MQLYKELLKASETLATIEKMTYGNLERRPAKPTNKGKATKKPVKKTGKAIKTTIDLVAISEANRKESEKLLKELKG